MDNKSHSSIPQGLRNQEDSFKADPLEKEEKFKSNANSRLNQQSYREDIGNNIYGEDQRFGGNLNYNGERSG